MKLGMIGLDTSHVREFVKVFNDPKHPNFVADMPLVKAFPGGSQNTSVSYSRVDNFTKEVAAAGVEIVDSMQALEGLDGYLLESVDGLQHLEQFSQLAQFGKPVFIDKPLTCSYAAAKAILDVSRKTGVPFMTASSMRYAVGVADLCPEGETVSSAEGFGPLSFLPDYRDYFWYGIHTVETIYHYLGAGCEAVEALSRGDTELLVGTWKDGRLGLCVGNRTGAYRFGARILTNKTQHTSVIDNSVSYMGSMSTAIAAFMRTGVSPIAPQESVEVIAFLEAASRSHAAGGRRVTLAELDK